MKKIFFLTIFLFISFLSFGQCPSSEITLSSQADIDNFIINFPGCTQILDGLTIDGNNVDNLSPLSVITSVQGNLKILNTINLTNLNGLQNLVSIASTERLEIKNNSGLTSIASLSSLTGTIPGILEISRNPMLSSLSGLEGITEVQVLRLVELPITNLVGLDNLASCGYFGLSFNNNLVDLTGMENLETVTNEITIGSNVSLQNISALQNLQSDTLTGRLIIADNPMLSSLEGLEALNSIGSFEIFANGIINLDGLQGITVTGSVINFLSGDNLTSVAGFIDGVTSTGLDLFIHNSPNLITLDGLFTAGSNNIVLENLTIENNPQLSDLTGLEGISEISGTLWIRDNVNLMNFNGFQNVIVNSLNLKNNPALITMQGFLAAGTTVTFIIENNASLIDLTGFEVAFRIDGAIENNASLVHVDALQNVDIANLSLIRDNPSLISLAGLTGPMFENAGFVIQNNDALQTLNGIEGLELSSANIIIEDNELLEDISALAYVDINEVGFYRIQNNPNLSTCNILSLCNLISNPNTIVQNNAVGCNSNAEVEASCNFTFNIIEGNAKYDFNLDACDTTDYNVSSLLIEVEEGGDSVLTATDNNGDYRIFVEEGTYTTSVVNASIPPSFSVLPESQDVTFTGFGNLEEIDFCLTADLVYNDLNVLLFPIEIARPGFDIEYFLVYKNVGTTVLSGSVTLEFDDSRQQFLGATPINSTINGNLITWNFTDLLPFQSKIINLSFNNFPPPTNEDGDILSFTATINPITGDVTPDDNVYIVNQILLNSQDPNDKIVNQGFEIQVSEVGDYLDYMVRFQNVGSASAVNVRIEDILSDNLDWNSFRIINSSHLYRLEITNQNEVAVFFDNIFLPSVQTDPEGSNGYLAFQVRSLETLQVGDMIENTANIFFDFNAPIETNTVITAIVDELGIGDINLETAVEVYPNPVSEILQIETSQGIVVKEMAIYSIQGKKLLATSAGTIDVSLLASGVYFVTIITESGNLTKKIIKN